MRPKKVAFLTAGGLAPCLSSALAGLLQRYTEIDPSIELLAYRNGYQGVLRGDSIPIDDTLRAEAARLHAFGGSPIGNSRVKLTNREDCEKRGLVEPGEDPQEKAERQLIADRVDVLHTIGGDDTNTAAAELAAHLAESGRDLTVIGLPKTIDNDVFPIRQSLGAATAAEQGARFFRNVVAETGANPRMLILHEVMGRNCGWLTAATAREYRRLLDDESWSPGIGLSRERREIHGVYLPEREIDLAAEAERLRGVLDRLDGVNLFLSEGAGVSSIVAEMEKRGEEVPRDAFGHVRLDKVNPGQYFGQQFAEAIGAEKVLVQKSGYFCRSAPANAEDLRLIQACVDLAVECALRREPGVIGHDEDRGNVLRAIEFDRIAGGKPFDPEVDWFRALREEIGQP
jgi:pyrophosphate--fructose-6-phosphate 1-phosphotransferase